MYRACVQVACVYDMIVIVRLDNGVYFATDDLENLSSCLSFVIEISDLH